MSGESSWEDALDLIELSGNDGLILWRPRSRPLNGAWWSTGVPDPSPEASALIRRIEKELGS